MFFCKEFSVSISVTTGNRTINEVINGTMLVEKSKRENLTV